MAILMLLLKLIFTIQLLFIDDSTGASNSNPNKLTQMDLIYSSMFVIKNNTLNENQVKAPDFNSNEIQILPPSLVKDYLLVGGDVLISNNYKKLNRTKRMKRKAILEHYPLTSELSRWPNKTIPYDFDSEIETNQKLMISIKKAIDHWNSKTCVRFEPFNKKKHSKTHRAKLRFSSIEKGCFSNIGYPDMGFEKLTKDMIISSVYLSNGCVLGQIIHELGHVIGFFHEQARSDRDDYIEIIWENIFNPTFNSINFESAASQIEPENLGIQYDISSIMHYQPTAFSKNMNKTIIARDRNLEFLMGNRAGLSFYDIKTANKAYKCDESCEKSVKCEFDGFLDASCKCVCPEGITGKYCETFISKTTKSKSIKDLKLNCTFDNDTCGWIQEKFKDEIDFETNSGKTLLADTRGSSGPLSDRFGPDSNGSYLYINSYYFKTPNESAILVSPLISHNEKDGENYCLQFWYHMFSNRAAVVGQLSVLLANENDQNDLITVWSRAGGQNQNQTEWLSARINLKIDRNFRLIFKAQRYFTYYGDIAIDDVEINNSTCKENDSHQTEWSNWYFWSPCSSKCGIGSTSRFRVCQIGSNKNESQECHGISYQTSSCYNLPCEDNTTQLTQKLTNATLATTTALDSINLNDTETLDSNFTIVSNLTSKQSFSTWSEWSSWSDCSTCDTLGYIKRTRLCKMNIESSFILFDNLLSELFDCPGHKIERKDCSSLDECRVDGGWSQWSEWSECNSTCHGLSNKTRTRKCDSPTPKNGGKYCHGHEIELEPCNSNKNCNKTSEFSSLIMDSKINNAVTEWSEWSKCSAECGFGVRSRTRKCVNPKVSCSKYLNDLQLCRGYDNCVNVQKIVSTSYSFNMIQTTPIKETSSTTTLGTTSLSFKSTNIQTRPLESVSSTVISTSTIESTYSASSESSTKMETTTETNKHVTSHWSSWSSWSECSASCHEKGIRIRKRYCIQNSEEENCKDTDPIVETMNCTQTKCGSDFICTFDHPGEPFCRYQLMNTGNYSFELVGEKSQTKFTGPISDYPTKTGKYMLAFAGNSLEGERAIFESNWLKSKYNGQCLTFWYSMYGTQMGRFVVKLIANNTEHVIFEKKGNQGNVGWLKGSSFIPDNFLYKIRFEAIRGSGPRSDLGLDYVILKDSDECQVMHCSFEDQNTCQFEDQTVINKENKGIRDYFMPFLGLNFYKFIFLKDQYQSELKLPFFDFQYGQSVCLSFSFNFVGEAKKSLNIYVIKDDYLKQLIWSTNPNNNNNNTIDVGSSKVVNSAWNRAYVDIINHDGYQLFSTYKIIFEAKLDDDLKAIGPEEIKNSIELDEINIAKSYCSAFKITKPRGRKFTRVKRSISKMEPKLEKCGGSFILEDSRSNLIISSPNYPNNYFSNMECTYLLKTKKDNRLMIKIIDLDIETSEILNLCPDYLEIRYYAIGQMGLRLCGSIKKLISNQNKNLNSTFEFISDKNLAFIKFHSDWTTNKSGFKLLVNSVPSFGKKSKNAI